MNFDATYWNNLKIKYQAEHFTNNSPILEFILSKAELVLSLNDFEKHWLKENHLSPTLSMIENLQKEKAKLAVKLQSDFQKLGSKYKTFCSTSWKENNLYLIFLKLTQEETLKNSEVLWLQKQPRSEIQKLAILNQKIDEFCKLKNRYKIVKRLDLSLESLLPFNLTKIGGKRELKSAGYSVFKKASIRLCT